MASEELELLKMQVKDSFDLHPSRREIIVSATPSPHIFNAIFNYAIVNQGSGGRDRGHVSKLKRDPHITFFTDNAQYMTRDTLLTVDGDPFKVWIVKTDETDETFQGEAWLVKA